MSTDQQDNSPALPADPPLPGRGGRIHSLDVLRLIACAWVFASHGKVMLNYDGFVWWAHLGVECFFAASGFVITSILLADRVRGRSLRDFLWRRALRIFPAFYLCMGLALWITWLAPAFLPQRTVHWSQFVYIYNLVVAHVNRALPEAVTQNQVWTLCVEEQFYLVWPLIVFVLPRRISLGVIAGMILPLAAWSIWFWRDQYVVLYYSTLPHVLAIGAGALMAYFERAARSLRAAPLAAMLLLGGSALAVALHRPWAVALSQSLIAIGSVLLCLSAIEPLAFGRVRSRLDWLTDAGMMTYGLYLYHLLIFQIVEGFALGWPVFVLAVGITIGVTMLSFYGVEKPLMRYGRRPAAAPAMQPAAVPVP